MTDIGGIAPPPAKTWFGELFREGARHQPEGVAALFITVGSVAAALYVLWVGAAAVITGDLAGMLANYLKHGGNELPWLESFSTWARSFTSKYHLDISVFIAITFPIAFLTTTARQSRTKLAWTDVALAAIAFAVAMYYIIDNDRFLNWSRGFSRPTTADYIAGLTLIVLVVELARRSTGWGLTSVTVILLAFAFLGHLLPGALKHENFTWRYFIEMATIMEDGIFGSPLDVASSYVLLFVLFGSFYQQAGGGKLFYELASGFTGNMRGGAAKACISASALYGSVSGSPSADVATTGPLTIPIMKKTGVSAIRAGAIEATASTGGAILPPVMGAVAFIMADMTNIPYAQIAWAATLPSILYYVSLYLLVHIDAIRYDEGKIPPEDVVNVKQALKNGWVFFLPLVAMIVLLVMEYTPTYVAAGSTMAVIALSWLTPKYAIGPRKFVIACVETIAQLVPLIGAVAAAGLIIGCFEVTGLAGKISVVLFGLSFGEMAPTLILAAAFLILLGMGMPTVAVYTLGVALLAPVLIGKLGLPLMGVHLFLVFYASLSAITPPVAVANFAAGAIAGANPTSLGPYACKLTVGGFMVPFFFLFNTGVLMDGSLTHIATDFVIGGLMVAYASLGLHGWWGKTPIPRPARIVMGISSLAMIHPAPYFQWPATFIGGAIVLGLWKLLPAAASASAIRTSPAS
jgi:TRAP transporter 4TM/12TM fusion protein